MDSLENLYRKEKLLPEHYLKGVEKLAPTGWGVTGYKESLSLYQQIAFKADTPSLHKVKYYNFLSIDADLLNMFGSCIFYKEKEIAEYKKLKPLLNKDFSMSLLLISLYQSTGQEKKSMEAFLKVLPKLRKVASGIKTEKETAESTETSLKIITYAIEAIKNNPELLKESFQLTNDICEAAKNSNDSNFERLLPRYKYYLHVMRFGYFRFYEPNNYVKAERELNIILDILKSESYSKVAPFPEPYLLSEVYFLAAQYYTYDRHQPSTALHYLKLMRALNLMEDQNKPTEYLTILAHISREKGDYQTAYSYMDSAQALGERVRLQQLSDKDNNLYAQAQAEEQQLLRQREESLRQDAEVKLLVTIACGLLAIVGGILLAMYLRQKQRTRLAEFKLNMARTIHDETVPALFYARTLARSYRLKGMERQDKQNELELHLENTLDSLRSLSHDLQADRHFTISDLCDSMEKLLKKLNLEDSFMYAIKKDIIELRFIGHYQYVQLKAVLNECITNTLKHASFKFIKLSFSEMEGKLIISYSDNGKGWDLASEKKGTGIGLKNMKKRVELLSGKFAIDSQYPNGYEIRIVLSLRDINNHVSHDH